MRLRALRPGSRRENRGGLPRKEAAVTRPNDGLGISHDIGVVGKEKENTKTHYCCLLLACESERQTSVGDRNRR